MRLAFFGVGHWHAGMHADAARAAAAEIVAAWDPEPEKTHAFAARHGGRAVDRVEAVLAEKPDLAIVMGRPAEMAALAGRFIELGVPMLIEKPVGISGAVLKPIADAAERRGSFAAVALAHRFSPVLAEVAALAREDRLGAVSQSHFRLINGPPRRYVDDGCGWVLDAAIGGGGALRNLGVHGIDAYLALAGEQPVEVEHAAFGRQVHGTEVEDYAFVTLRAADGSLGLVEAGYTYASLTSGLFEWRVSAANATLIDMGNRLLVATLDDGGSREAAATAVGQRYELMMADTLERLKSGRRPTVSLLDHWRAADIIDRCYATRTGG